MENVIVSIIAALACFRGRCALPVIILCYCAMVIHFDASYPGGLNIGEVVNLSHVEAYYLFYLSLSFFVVLMCSAIGAILNSKLIIFYGCLTLISTAVHGIQFFMEHESLGALTINYHSNWQKMQPYIDVAFIGLWVRHELFAALYNCYLHARRWLRRSIPSLKDGERK